MFNIVRKSDRRTKLRLTRQRLNNALVSASLLLLFGFIGCGAAAGEDVRNESVTSVGPGPQFAIADFDGDLRPDIASVQVGSNGSGSTDYWIQLQLSAGGRQFIRVVAPTGGLLIEARDVNGDHAVDLVLATAWFRQPVAIFLNDGHGNFSRVEPAVFPAAFSESAANWASAFDQAAEAAGLPPRSRTGICPEARALPSVRSHTDSIPRSSAGFLLDSFLVSHAGRAPPSEVPNS
jgi:hypothetical protein